MRIKLLLIVATLLGCFGAEKDAVQEKAFHWVAQVYPVKVNKNNKCNVKDKAHTEYERVFSTCMVKFADILNRGVVNKKPIEDPSKFQYDALHACIDTATKQAEQVYCMETGPEKTVYAFRRSIDPDCRQSEEHSYTVFKCVPCEEATLTNQKDACRSVGFDSKNFKAGIN